MGDNWITLDQGAMSQLQKAGFLWPDDWDQSEVDLLVNGDPNAIKPQGLIDARTEAQGELRSSANEVY